MLATLLAHPSTSLSTVPHVLSVYDTVRRPFAQHVQAVSFHVGEIYWLETPEMQHVTAEASAAGSVPMTDLRAMCDKLIEVHRWTWDSSLGDDCEDAVRKLEAEVGGGS